MSNLYSRLAAGFPDFRCDSLRRSGRAFLVALQAAAEVVPIASHGERGCADRAAKVEGEDLRAFVAPELQRHQREQY